MRSASSSTRHHRVMDVAVLSEVHQETVVAPGHAGKIVISRFRCRHPAPAEGPEPDVGAEQQGARELLDADGDTVLVRRRRWVYEDYAVSHAMATPIGDVGLQVWAGALLLAEFIVHQRGEWAGEVVLELGAGTGLVAAVAARHAAHVLATDIGHEVLANMVDVVGLNRTAGASVLARGEVLAGAPRPALQPAASPPAHRAPLPPPPALVFRALRQAGRRTHPHARPPTRPRARPRLHAGTGTTGDAPVDVRWYDWADPGTLTRATPPPAAHAPHGLTPVDRQLFRRQVPAPLLACRHEPLRRVRTSWHQ